MNMFEALERAAQSPGEVFAKSDHGHLIVCDKGNDVFYHWDKEKKDEGYPFVLHGEDVTQTEWEIISRQVAIEIAP